MNLDFLNETLASDPRPLVVEFWAPWCAPCRRMAPLLEKNSAQYADRVRLIRVNADEEIDLVRSLQVKGIPTLIAYTKEGEVQRITGALNATQLQTFFAALAAGEQPPKPGIAPQDRVLRLFSGAALTVLGLGFGPVWWLVILGAAITFSGVYDRCPIYRAVAPRVKTLLRIP